MVSVLDTMKSFDIPNATLSLWIFRKTEKDKVPSYTGRWIDTTGELETALKSAVSQGLSGVTETMEYGILNENNDSSALSITINETYANLILEQSADEVDARKVKKIKDINNAAFYVIKMVVDGDILYAVRKTDDTWRTRKSRTIISAVFKDDVMDIESNTSFNISKYVDFFVHGENILILEKRHFESLLSYRAGHIKAFAELQEESDFSSIFSDMTHLKSFVGENKIQLRRASAIHQKGHYKDPAFMKNLRDNCVAMKLSIEFDTNGKIILTEQNCRDVFIALLDHRLDSRLSKKLFDVPSTAEVSA